MLANLFSRNRPEPDEKRAMQIWPWGDWGTSAGTGPASSGVNVSQDSALGLCAVFGAVSLISDTVATMPIDVYRDNPDGTRTEMTTIPKWINQPSQYVDRIEFVNQTLLSLLLDGNAYWTYGLDGNFLPTNVKVLNPIDVSVHDVGNGPQYMVKGAPTRAPLQHIKAIVRPGALKGISPIEAARQSIGVGLAAQEYAGAFYKNGSSSTGVISVPGDLSPEQARDLKAAWARGNSGLANAHTPSVITGGATWTQISVTPEQAQFLATREFQAGEIVAQAFLIDPSLLGIAINRGQNLTYGNLTDRKIHFIQFTCNRWIVRLQEAYKRLLPTNWCAEFDTDEFQKADIKTRAEVHQIALGGPTGNGVKWTTPQEVRDEEDLGPAPSELKTMNEPKPTPAPTNAPPSGNGSGTMKPMNGTIAQPVGASS